MSDSAVAAKTGKNWAGWFAVLDAASAAKLDHRAIAALLAEKQGVPNWWRQMIAVEYERARGLRSRHETAGGYSVAIAKTVAMRLPDLFAATADAKKRRQWFPQGVFSLSSLTKDKYVRGSWKTGARLDIGFCAKGKDKAQIAVQVSKLAEQTDVERERATWKAALSKLQEQVW
jgi:hypothetical protein